VLSEILVIFSFKKVHDVECVINSNPLYSLLVVDVSVVVYARNDDISNVLITARNVT